MKTGGALALAGGQGKTTLIFFLSLMLAKAGKTVLAVDADPQANLTLYLRQAIDPGDATLLEALKNKDLPPEKWIYPVKASENLFLVPSDRRLESAAEFLAGSGAGGAMLRQRVVRKVKDSFDFCLIDSQPTRSQIARSVAGAADTILIPAEALTKGANSVLDTLDFLDELADLGVFEGQILGIVPFRDRYFGRSQAVESRRAIDAMTEFATEADIAVLDSVVESERIKTALNKGELPPEDLRRPFECIVERLLADG